MSSTPSHPRLSRYRHKVGVRWPNSYRQTQINLLKPGGMMKFLNWQLCSFSEQMEIPEALSSLKLAGAFTRSLQLHLSEYLRSIQHLFFICVFALTIYGQSTSFKHHPLRPGLADRFQNIYYGLYPDLWSWTPTYLFGTLHWISNRQLRLNRSEKGLYSFSHHQSYMIYC